MSTTTTVVRPGQPIARRPQPAAPAAPAATVKLDPHRVQSSTQNELRASRQRVVIRTTNREYVGTLVSFDIYTPKLDTGVLVFKHAVESIAPAVTP